MRKFFCLFVLLHVCFLFAVGQAKTRRLPGIINHPSLNVYAPYVSHDGNALLFVSDMGEDGTLTVAYTSRENDWIEPVELPKTMVNRSSFLKGFALSADGKTMFFTSAKTPVVGGYDILSSDLKGRTWTEPQNLFLPVNSKSNDGCPSPTVDGQSLYFMRCDKMDHRTAAGCKLFRVDKKSNGQWNEPKELPSNINTGNSQSPRIMADGETLIFASDKMAGGKGGMDLYVTKLINGTWSDPRPLDFVNTEQDDQFVAVSALGRYLIKETPGARKNSELVEFLIPDELRPKGMMKVEGSILDQNGTTLPAYITITDLSNGKRVHSGRPAADGSYFVYVREGSKYEFSVDPEQSKVSYFVKQFDLTSERILQRERINVVLKQPAPGDELLLEGIQFKPLTAQLDLSSDSEMKKLVRLMKANPELNFEIQILLEGYEEDSVRSSPDLTEILIDSINTQIDDIDSLGQLYKRDTVITRTTYHNDRTQLQANAIVDNLVVAGIKSDNLIILTNAIPAVLPENRKLVIKAVARSKSRQ
jgi:Tol biopolymer transport system component